MGILLNIYDQIYLKYRKLRNLGVMIEKNQGAATEDKQNVSSEAKAPTTEETKFDNEELDGELQDGCEDMLRLAEVAATATDESSLNGTEPNEYEEEAVKLTSEMASRITKLRKAKFGLS